MKSKPTRPPKRVHPRPVKPARRGALASTRAVPRDPLPDSKWILRLYVAGQTPRSLAAFANLKRLCDHHLADRYSIEVIDLVKQPQLAQGDQIVAVPTLVRRLPEPVKRVIGDLSNIARVIVGMDLKPAHN